MITLTAYSSVLLPLAVLHLAWERLRTQPLRLMPLLFSVVLSILVTVLAWNSITKDQFPVESCFTFFKAYRPAIRKYFVVESILFWVCAICLLSIGVADTPCNQRMAFLEAPCSWAKRFASGMALGIVIFQTAFIIIVVHAIVPEQELRKEAGDRIKAGHGHLGRLLVYLSGFQLSLNSPLLCSVS